MINDLRKGNIEIYIRKRLSGLVKLKIEDFKNSEILVEYENNAIRNAFDDLEDRRLIVTKMPIGNTIPATCSLTDEGVKYCESIF